MKKTLTINLGGTVYHIDEDAYRLLDNYLSNLKHHFRKQKGAEEIVTDIENRIAELFGEKLQGGRQVISIHDVEEVIAQVGKPEDFADDTAEEEPNKDQTHSSEQKSTYTQSSGTAYRKLYRDIDDRVLAGVASGLAAYFNWDVALVRILMVALIFVPYVPIVLIYIILWIVVPEAITAAEKLKMRGEAVTLENIGKTVTDGFERVSNGVNDYVRSGKPRSFLQQVGDALVSIASFVFKLFVVALLIVCFPVLFALAVAFVALIIGLIAAAIGGGALLFNIMPDVDWTPLMSVSPLLTIAGTWGGVALIGIPLAGLVYTLIRQLFNWPPMNATAKWVLFILWIIGLVLFIINLSALGWQFPLYGLHVI